MKKAAVAVALTMICVQTSRPQSPDPHPSAAHPDALIVPSGQIFIMQLDTPLHTRTTKKGDKVEFHTAADVMIDNKIAIPNDSLISGEVIKSKRAGLLFGRAEIQLHFEQVKLSDGTMLPIQATITRAGFDPIESQKGEDPKLKGESGPDEDIKDAAKAGAQGALAGILYGGPKGALYGAGIGAASSLIVSLFRRGPDLDLPRRTMFEARFDKPVEIPEAAVLAQNTPAAPQPAAILDRNYSQEQDQVKAVYEPEAKRPILRRPRTDRQPEEASASKPDSASAASPDEKAEDAKQAKPVFGGVNISVKVKMVQVDAVVKDSSGRMMEGLRADEFRVYEDGVLQEIASFSQDQLPLAVALVLDRSGSIAPYIAELRRIANSALRNLKPEDQVCLFSFAADAQRLEGLTTDRQRIAAAIDRIRAGGRTDIMDALQDAVRYLANAAPDSRHAIILISDNQQTVTPTINEREVIMTAQETDTVVYSLKTPGEPLNLGSRLPSMISGDPVNKVAHDTGGEVIKVSQVSSLDSALRTVIARLRTRYFIGYYPSGTAQGGVFHTIKVRLDDKFGQAGRNYFIQAKRGYYSVGG